MIKKIVSGGQTGADRAALDFAIHHAIPHGGWCPKGRLAEDGTIEPRYELQETSTKQYPQRTEKNVQDSDATVVFTIAAELKGGSRKTLELAHKYSKPVLHLHCGVHNVEERLLAFVMEHSVGVLNVAGSRASKEPGVGSFVKSTLEAAFFPQSQASIGAKSEGLNSQNLALNHRPA